MTKCKVNIVMDDRRYLIVVPHNLGINRLTCPNANMFISYND